MVLLLALVSLHYPANSSLLCSQLSHITASALMLVAYCQKVMGHSEASELFNSRHYTNETKGFSKHLYSVINEPAEVC